jgi:hypothetical protein
MMVGRFFNHIKRSCEGEITKQEKKKDFPKLSNRKIKEQMMSTYCILFDLELLPQRPEEAFCPNNQKSSESPARQEITFQSSSSQFFFIRT